MKHTLLLGNRVNSRRFAIFAVALISVGTLVSIATDSPVEAADNAGAITMTVGVAPAVRSITVSSTGSTSYTSCTRAGVSTGATLSAPNGVCTTSSGQLSVVLGEVASVVDVATSNMTATGATPWTPCATCVPGQDQFKLEIVHPFGAFAAVAVTGTPACDTSTFVTSPVLSCITIPANSTGSPNLRITGPSIVSSNVTTPWSHVITWRAMPPAGA